MAEKTPTLTELGASDRLVFNHLDRISDDLAGVFSVTKESADKLLLYSLQVMHLETLLIADLDKEYEDSFKRYVKPKIDKIPIGYTWSNIRHKKLFFEAYNEWCQLLILQARKRGYLGRKRLSYGRD